MRKEFENDLILGGNIQILMRFVSDCESMVCDLWMKRRAVLMGEKRCFGVAKGQL